MPVTACPARRSSRVTTRWPGGRGGCGPGAACRGRPRQLSTRSEQREPQQHEGAAAPHAPSASGSSTATVEPVSPEAISQAAPGLLDGARRNREAAPASGGAVGLARWPRSRARSPSARSSRDRPLARRAAPRGRRRARLHSRAGSRAPGTGGRCRRERRPPGAPVEAHVPTADPPGRGRTGGDLPHVEPFAAAAASACRCARPPGRRVRAAPARAGSRVRLAVRRLGRRAQASAASVSEPSAPRSSCSAIATSSSRRASASPAQDGRGSHQPACEGEQGHRGSVSL